MPKEMKAFQTEYEKLRQQGLAVHGESKAIINSSGHFYGQIGEAAKAIGKRVQLLKNGGQQGATVKDFLGDKEVSQYYAGGLRLVKEAKVNHERLVKNYAAGKVVYGALVKLQKELLAEAKVRKAKKIGKESQSAPEMEKLSGTITRFVEDPPGKLMPALEEMNLAPPKFTLDADYNAEIADAMANTKDVVSREQSEFLDRQMDVRVLTGHLATVKKVSADLKAALTVVAKVMAQGKPVDPASVSSAVKTFAAMKATVDPLKKAYESNKSWINDSKEAKKINGMMQQIDAAYAEATRLMIDLRARLSPKK